MARITGIDLGTTNSGVSFMDGMVTVKRRSLIDFPVRETRKPSPSYVRPSAEKFPTQGTGTWKTPAPKEVEIFSLEKLLTEGKSAGELGAAFMRGDHEIKRAIPDAVSRIGLRGDFHNIVTAAMKDLYPEMRILSLKLYSAAV